MSPAPHSVLLVDDDRELCETLAQALGHRGYAVTFARSAAEGLALAEAGAFETILTDLHMPGMDGLELCRRLVAARPDLPVILLTAFGSMETAVGAIRAGAWDFLTKPFEMDALCVCLDRAIRHRALEEEVGRLRAEVAGRREADELLGESPAIVQLRAIISRVAQTDVSVLITGESGVGKEVVARAVHRLSARGAGPIIAVNCAAMPEALLESELFGHVRGAFTDARTARAGLVFQAEGGTLFLDEVGELPLNIQPKLLRAVQERVARPVGGDREQPFNARLLFATNRDLQAEVEAGRFREDLYYRMNVVQLDVPPLRARGADSLLLAQHFVKRSAARLQRPVAGFGTAVAERILAYDWPGNVRELSNAMERAVALTEYREILVGDLPERIRASQHRPVMPAIDDAGDLMPLADLERRYIDRVLASVQGNKASAARILGIDRKTLYRKLGSDDVGS